MSPEELAVIKELDEKHAARKALGLPKYEKSTLVGYSQYLRRVGYSEEQIKEIIEAARKE